jgi:hypothetical protein
VVRLTTGRYAFGLPENRKLPGLGSGVLANHIKQSNFPTNSLYSEKLFSFLNKGLFFTEKIAIYLLSPRIFLKKIIVSEGRVY